MTSEETSGYDQIYEFMKDAKLDEATEYVERGKLEKIDCGDVNGTTPLQYAAFRGYYDLCKLLLSMGADVNAKSHDQGYSALMFAAIANKPDIVSLLLEHHADTDCLNSIGRTAMQMAAFVNSNEAVDLIKGYIPRKSLEYYTEITGISESEPKLPKGKCCDELYGLLTGSINYSPVRVLKAIRGSSLLFENRDKVVRTLDAFVTKAVKDTEDGVPNDVLAFKLHFYKYIFEYLIAQKKLMEEKKKPEEVSAISEDKLYELCIKRLLTEESVQTIDLVTKKPTSSHMFRAFEDKFLRESIRQFPYPECGLIQQMVMILSKTPVGTGPSALQVISDCLNGQRMNGPPSDEVRTCASCLERRADLKVCTHCRRVAYCDQFCQRMNWPQHKKESIVV